MAATKEAVTLRQLAIAAGYESISALADAAEVPEGAVYKANQGVPPSEDAIDALVSALNRGPTKTRVSRDDLLDAVALGFERRLVELRRPRR